MANNKGTMDENPLTLHNSDNPSIILVSQLLEPHNYGQWSWAMRISLSAKNKIGIIDKSIKKLSSTDKAFHSWQRCNDMVLSWILNSMSPVIASSIICMDTTTTPLLGTQQAFSMVLEHERQLDIFSRRGGSNIRFQAMVVRQASKTIRGNDTRENSFSHTGGMSKKMFFLGSNS
ncbi:hypothetical protein GYH30_047547 [Glycine max]|uniref:Retrotransposon Copia-like N-terminal domain-containing protein n=1 Tax=Glycine max TaxID=3847 RepID=A0A0R0FN67_SOYBN|nr:hypothetical protein GYH30_047547 [Glycine max]